MATIVELPRLSDTMEEGVIAKWHVAVGDKVKRGQVIADVETDKATMEFESFDSGTVLKLIAAEGESMPIGTPIAVLGKPGEDAETALSGKSKTSKAEPSKPAAPSKSGSESARPEAPEPAPAPTPAGHTEPVLTPEVEDEESGDSGGEESGQDDDRIAASPIARRLARENGLRLSDIKGSGPHGRIVKTDVEAAVAGSGAKASGAASSGTVATAGGRPYFSQPDAPQKLSQM